jgi:hypothetical protein
MLEGRSYLDAGSARRSDVERAILDRPPRPPTPRAPPALARVVLRGLAKDPAARYASAREVADAIGEAARAAERHVAE